MTQRACTSVWIATSFRPSLACTSMQTPVCALHTASLRPALASCVVSDKKRTRDRFCIQDAPRARKRSSYPQWQFARESMAPTAVKLRRSLTFSASATAHAVSAAAHAVSAAPALGGHPAGFLTSLSTAAVPRSCPASRTTPQPVAASGLHAPATQGPPQGREARHHVTLCQHCTAHAHGLSSPVSSILCR